MNIRYSTIVTARNIRLGGIDTLWSQPCGVFLVDTDMAERAKSFFKFFSIGEYPPEYNPRVHGPYDPSRNYGKRMCFVCVLTVL